MLAFREKVGGGVPQKALRSIAGMVPLGLPRGERSEDRERIFHAGKNSRLSDGLPRAHLSLFLTLGGCSGINPLFDLPIKEVKFIGFYRY